MKDKKTWQQILDETMSNREQQKKVLKKFARLVCGVERKRAGHRHTDEYGDPDPVQDFVRDECALDNYDADHHFPTFIPTLDLWQTYRQWCLGNKIPPHGLWYFEHLILKNNPITVKVTFRRDGQRLFSGIGFKINHQKLSSGGSTPK